MKESYAILVLKQRVFTKASGTDLITHLAFKIYKKKSMCEKKEIKEKFHCSFSIKRKLKLLRIITLTCMHLV